MTKNMSNAVVDVEMVWWDAAEEKVWVVLRRADGDSAEYLIDPADDITNQTPGVCWPPDEAGHASYVIVKDLIQVEVDAYRNESPQPRPRSIDQLNYQLDDHGNARKFVDWHGANFRLVSENRRKALPWAWWDGRVWQYDKLGVVPVAAGKLVDLYDQWVKDLPTNTEQNIDFMRRSAKSHWTDDQFSLNGHFTNLKHLRSDAGFRAHMKMLDTFPEVLASATEFDSTPYLFNTLNGVLDLRGEGALHEHAPEYMATKVAPVRYDPTATCSKWKEFLRRPFDNDDEVITCFQRMMGQAMFGDVEEKSFPILVGPGDTGKTVIGNTLRWVFGSYAGTANWRTLTADNGRGIPNDLAALAGVRFVLVTEPPQDMVLDLSLLKAWTGGDAGMQARFLYGEFFEFKPAGTLLLVTNHLPRVTETGDAPWNRMVTFETKNPVPKSEQRRLGSFALEFKREGSGILNWLMDGYQAWRREGLNPPESIVMRVKEYRESEDDLGQLLNEVLVTAEPTAFVTLPDVFDGLQRVYMRQGVQLRDQLNQLALSKVLAARIPAERRRRDRLDDGTRTTFYYGFSMREPSAVERERAVRF